MNVKQHKADDTSKSGCVLHRTLCEGGAEVMPEDPGKLAERRMEEINLRATVIGPVLKGFLHEPHGMPRWGLNE